jgi:hypothetical protein
MSYVTLVQPEVTRARSTVPCSLRDELLTKVPIVFADQTVAEDVWLFGTLLTLECRDPYRYVELVTLIAERLADCVTAQLLSAGVLGQATRIAICAFGSVVTAICQRTKSILRSRGYESVFVAELHNYASPEFRYSQDKAACKDAFVFSISDVAHRGSLIRRMAGVIPSGRRLFNLAIVDQSAGQCSAGICGLWEAPAEERIPLDEYKRLHPNQNGLAYFEPETGLARHAFYDRLEQFSPVVHATHALSFTRSKSWGKPSHLSGKVPSDFLYSIDALKLFGIEQRPDSVTQQARKMARDLRCKAVWILSELIVRSDSDCCIVVDEDQKRALRFAKHLLSEASPSIQRTPIIPLPSHGVLESDALSQIRKYRTIILVDCATRTGRTLLSLKDRILRESEEANVPDIVAFVGVGRLLANTASCQNSDRVPAESHWVHQEDRRQSQTSWNVCNSQVVTQQAALADSQSESEDILVRVDFQEEGDYIRQMMRLHSVVPIPLPPSTKPLDQVTTYFGESVYQNLQGHTAEVQQLLQAVQSREVSDNLARKPNGHGLLADSVVRCHGIALYRDVLVTKEYRPRMKREEIQRIVSVLCMSRNFDWLLKDWWTPNMFVIRRRHNCWTTFALAIVAAFDFWRESNTVEVCESNVKSLRRNLLCLDRSWHERGLSLELKMFASTETRAERKKWKLQNLLKERQQFIIRLLDALIRECEVARRQHSDLDSLDCAVR